MRLNGAYFLACYNDEALEWVQVLYCILAKNCGLET